MRSWRVGIFAISVSGSLVLLPSVPARQAKRAGPGVYQGDIGVGSGRRVIPDAQQSFAGLRIRATCVPSGEILVNVLSRPELGKSRVDGESRLDHGLGQQPTAGRARRFQVLLE